MSVRSLGALAGALGLVFALEAKAQTTEAGAEPAQPFALHAQTTFVYQGQGDLRSPYRGANSLSARSNARETWDATLFAGFQPWRGAELWANPEIDQGFGLSNTLGAAGFPSGEAYKVGRARPYFRLQRLFVRQTLDLGGETEKVEGDLNQFAGERAERRIVLTAGKMSVGDVFDTNAYAHDPRGDFLNWTIIDVGSFDYAADAWGYSEGATVEWYERGWTARAGAFLLSDVPNSVRIDTSFKQFELVGEVEERHSIAGRAGKLKLTAYLNRGRMGRLDEAVALAKITGGAPDTAAVRRYAGRPGISLNLEQQITDDLGAFLRAGLADGAFEAYEFTDVDRSLSAGLSLLGKRWGRDGDRVGLAAVVNQASAARKRYLDAGGLGILVGDGRLPHPGAEKVAEAYYDLAVAKGAHLALDYQHVANPAYNRDRGPVSILALRLHGQI